MLERHYRLGGFTHTFTRPGYEWDVGVHYIGQVGERGALRALFDTLSEGRIRWAPLPDVYDRVELGSRSYDFVSGTGRFIETMGRAFPNERDAMMELTSAETARCPPFCSMAGPMPSANTDAPPTG